MSNHQTQALGRSARLITAACVALLVARCGAGRSSPTAPSEPNRFQLGGSWRFSLSSALSRDESCRGSAIESALDRQATGTLSITQDDINLTVMQSFDRGGSCTYRGVAGTRSGTGNLTMVSCAGLETISFQCSSVRNASGLITAVGTAGSMAHRSRVIAISYDLGKPVVDALTGRLTDNYTASWRQTDPPLDADFTLTHLAVKTFTATRR
jgi:hypothetical protein